MINPDENFLQEIIENWQPCSKEKLTLEDARESIFNLTGFFDTLDEIDRENNKDEEIKCEE